MRELISLLQCSHESDAEVWPCHCCQRSSRSGRRLAAKALVVKLHNHMLPFLPRVRDRTGRAVRGWKVSAELHLKLCCMVSVCVLGPASTETGNGLINAA